MSATLIHHVSEQELRQEREDLIRRVGMDEEQLLQQGNDWTLTTEDQWQVLDRIRGIRFLLGEDE